MVISASQTQNDLDSRFNELLKPIRDLTKNWDVDIASHLEEYLEELDKVTITFDAGETTMNFAEAALLIQGSACVYSKKVEYLYSLVYQMLDVIANKKKQARSSSVDENGNDEDANFNDKHDDDEFLSLDDIQEHKNIGLKEGDMTMDKSIYPIPQMPLSLIPLEEGEKGDNPLLSKLGEVLASRNDFKINTCSVHPSGALLLDMSHLGLLESSLKAAASSTPCQTIPEIEPSLQSIPEEKIGEINEPPDEGLPQDMSVDDNNDVLDMLGGEVDAAEPPCENEQNKHQMDTEEVVAIRKSERRTKRVQIITPKPVSMRRTERVQIITPKPFIDPWEPLDPHETSSIVEKPLKRGKTFRIPICLEDNTSKKRKRKQHWKEKTLPPLADFISDKYSNRSKYPKNPLKVTAFPEFDRMFWKEFKRRQALLKNEKKHANHQWTEEDDDDDQNDDEQQLLRAEDNDGDIDIDDEPDLVDDRLFDAIENALSNHGTSINAVDDLDVPDMSKGEIITSYEELVQKHVDAYLASAMEYAQITDLSRRVSDWEDRVIPKLQEEDKHESFDINKYGSRVLDNLAKNRTVPFKKVVGGKPEFEICRIFLASLMLANTMNVKIISHGPLEEGIDKFELELLSTKRHFEQLEEYQAPSITSKS